MHKLELAFFARVPGNTTASAHHGEKIFRHCPGRMNLLRIARSIDNAPNAGQRSKPIETVALIRHGERENAVFFQERIAIIKKADQVSGVFEHVRPDDPVIGVPATDEFGIAPTVPNEIDLLNVFDICSMRPKFFDQRLLVAMVEHVNVKALPFRRDRSAARPNLQPKAIALDVRQDNFLSPHDALTRCTMPLLRKLSEASLK